MFERSEKLSRRIADRIDLLVDLATLGEYGLELEAAKAERCELDGRRAAWEALATPRRGDCPPGTTSRAREQAPRTRRAARWGRLVAQEPAATYSPRPLRAKYHRRGEA